MQNIFKTTALFFILVLTLSSCLKNPFEGEEPTVVDFPIGASAFILNEGGFGYGNASVDHLDFRTGENSSSIF